MCGVCGCGHGGVTIEDGQGHQGHGHHGHRPHRHGPHGHGHHGYDHHGHGPHGQDHHGHGHHEHGHPLPGHPGADGAETRLIRVEQDLLAKNNAFAAVNRQVFAARGVFAVNFMSSPGAGKTTLLCRTLTDLAARDDGETGRRKRSMAVIEGDQQTSHDADRIRATGTPAVQVNTGQGCHLDANMVTEAVGRLNLTDGSLLFIENVGNLVCPAAFDLGEARKVVVVSTTEGEDKPLKYPNMFAVADLVLINKIDLVPHLPIDLAALCAAARRIKPTVEILQLSATDGTGLDAWYAWLDREATALRRPSAAAE